ncbi:MAG: hypothetical protein M1836_006031 [Candelina mexicana]|nr:MAG: hypothetical protein M1836_006031 [Candelina mexicana]
MPNYSVCVFVLCYLLATATASLTGVGNALAERDALGPVCDISTGWPTSYDCREASQAFNKFFTGIIDDGIFIYGVRTNDASFGQQSHQIVTPLTFVAAGYCAITIFNFPNPMIREHERNDTLKRAVSSIIHSCVESGGFGTGGYFRNLGKLLHLLSSLLFKFFLPYRFTPMIHFSYLIRSFRNTGLLGNLGIWVYSQWLPSGDFAQLYPNMQPSRRIGYSWRQQAGGTDGALIPGPMRPSQCFAKGVLDRDNITPDVHVQAAEAGNGRAGYCEVEKDDRNCCKGYRCVGRKILDSAASILLGTRKVLEAGICLFDQATFDQAVMSS